MSNCNNCYNGCAEVVSDQCVKYTGVDIPELGIQNGDTLAHVEQQITTFLVGALDGTGIILDINPSTICTLVKNYLPPCASCTSITLLDIIKALIDAVCDLQTQVNATNARIDVIEAPYTVGCLTGVISTSGTHAILQAVINKLCTVEANLAALTLNVTTNYVRLSDLNSLIAAYLSSLAPITQQNQKMVPYTVVEYYGPLTNFDAGGVGISALGWDKIYLCNGANGTPDKRGRLPVGVTTVPGGGAYSPIVDPSVIGNPNYTLGMTSGTNTVTLTVPQMPAHTHIATAISTPTDPGHLHTIAYAHGQADQNEPGAYGDLMDMNGTKSSSTSTNTATTGITVATSVTNSSTGGSQSHNNIPPVLACNYIMYIP